MPLPSSGPISLGQVAKITKGSSTATVSLGDNETRTLFGVASGIISMLSGRGKPPPGSSSYTIPGTYTFIVPVYETLSVDVMGGSGGGGGGADFVLFAYNCGGSPGGSGTESRFASSTPVVGGGGGGGGPGNNNYAASNGSASGGDSNYIGNSTFCLAGGAGGPSYGYPNGANGGFSGRATKQWSHASTSGNPPWSTSIQIKVGSAGTGGSGGQGAYFFVWYCTAGRYGSNGSKGYVNVSWS